MSENDREDRRILRKYRGMNISSMFGIEGKVVGVQYRDDIERMSNVITFILKVEDNPLAWNVDLTGASDVFIRNVDYNKSDKYMNAVCSLNKIYPC
tara:strand:+ start:36 stop:323 length:288 start_codon:yes stop_codon:yes gene_type:complete